MGGDSEWGMVGGVDGLWERSRPRWSSVDTEQTLAYLTGEVAAMTGHTLVALTPIRWVA